MQQLLPEQRPLVAADLLELYGSDAPALRVGFVLSVDGATQLGGSSRGLQNSADEAVFHALRGVCDAVLVGAGTLRRERYGPVRPRPDARAWRVAHGLSEQPPVVVVTRSCAFDAPLPPGAVVLTCEAADPQPLRDEHEVLTAGSTDVDLARGVALLAERGLVRLLCEGGPALVADLLFAGLIDELCLTSSPLLVGGGSAPLLPRPMPARLELRSLVEHEGVLLTRYAVDGPQV